MLKRTTIELDEELLARAKRALGGTTTRWTVEEALRRAVRTADEEFARRREAQLRDLKNLGRRLDLDVLRGKDEMWR